MSRKNPPTDSLASDTVWGVGNIAAEIGIPTPKAYYLIAQGKIPVTKLGHRTVVASRSQLRRLLSGDLKNDPDQAA